MCRITNFSDLKSLLSQEGDAKVTLDSARKAWADMNHFFLSHVAQLPAYDQQSYQKV